MMFFPESRHSVVLPPAALVQVTHADLHVQERNKHLVDDGRFVKTMMQLVEEFDVVGAQRLLDFIDVRERPEQVHHVFLGERGHSR